MLIYKDVLSGDEMFSDAFPIKVVDDIVYEVDCKFITVAQGANVDIGANPSAEEQDEALEEGAVRVIDLVNTCRLQSASAWFDKPGYTKYIKDYMKAVKAYLQIHNPERVGAFQTGAAKYVAKILKNFDKYELWAGEQLDPNGMVALLNYREDDTPYFTFWKDGLKEDKQ